MHDKSEKRVAQYAATHTDANGTELAPAKRMSLACVATLPPIASTAAGGVQFPPPQCLLMHAQLLHPLTLS